METEPKPSFSFFHLIFFSLVGTTIAGLTMAVLNVLIEIIKGNSVLKLKDIWLLALWHVLILFFIGIAVGLVIFVVTTLRKRVIFRNPSSLIYLCIFTGCWILLVSYVNISLLPSGLSSQALIGNGLLLVFGIIIAWMIFRSANRGGSQEISLLLKVYTALLIFLVVFSLALNADFLKKKAKSKLVTAPASSDKQNVIILILDSVRADHLGCYGYDLNTSPNIDALARQGVIFENAFAHASRTQESVPSLLTSTYPSTHNMKSLTNVMPKEMITLPQVFQANGYKTSVFSMISYVSPLFGFDKGVDDFYGQINNINEFSMLWHLLARSINYFPPSGVIIKNLLKLSRLFFPRKILLESKDAEFLTQKIIAWISGHKNAPFFVFAHYIGGHVPYEPPDPYVKMFDPEYSQKPVDRFPNNLSIFFPFTKGDPLPERELQNMIAQYDGEIYYHDLHLKSLFDFLKITGLDRNTILVITADHGEEFYEHQGWGHGHSLFDEVIQVPLIFYGPQILPKGKRIPSLVGLIDLFPTLCSLSGIGENLMLPYKIEGIDLSQMILSEAPGPAREFVFSEVSLGGKKAISLRTADWKAIIASFGRMEHKFLFDVRSDPREQINIINENDLRQRELFDMIKKIVEQAHKFKPRETTVDETTKEQLRSLGYIK